MFNLFTYGTLMSGECRNLMMRNCEFLGEHSISKYALAHYTADEFPVALYTGKKSNVIVGEIYSCPDDNMLAYMDTIEDEGFLYNRKTIEIDGIQCYFYLGNKRVWRSQLNYLLECKSGEKWSKDKFPKLISPSIF